MIDSYPQDQVDFSQLQRVLVIKLQLLGDVLLTTPVFSVLKQHYPHLKIDALVYADTAVVLRDNPDIDHIFCIDRNWKNSLRSKIVHEIELYQQLKARGYQLIISLTDRTRSAWLARLLGARFSVAQSYAYKRGFFWRRSFSHLYSRPKTPRHTVEVDLDALRRLGLQPALTERRLKMAILPETAQTISDLLTRYKLTANSYVVLHPLSRWMYKGWNTAGFAAVIEELGRRNIPTLMVSGPDANEVNYVQAILDEKPNQTINLAGKLSLSELAGLIAQARCFIGLDSVATHISAAVNTPCVVLFGPSNDKIWHPWHVQHRIVKTDVSCRPCGLAGCGNSNISDCLQAISPTLVVNSILDILNDQC